jgi:hypothetical protein
MSQPPAPRISDDDENDTSHVSTPIFVHLPASPPRPSSLLPSGSTSSESTKPAAVLPSAAHLRLPIPTLSANLSQTSFTFIDVTEGGSGVDFEDLPPEVNSADISIAREFLYSTFVSRLCVFYAQRIYRRIRRTVPLEPQLHLPVTNEASIFGLRFKIKALLMSGA